MDGEPVTLDILDTGGDEEFRHMLPQYARDYESFVLVYAINDHPSFEALEREFLTPIRDARPDQSRPPAVIVANKSDLGGSSYDGEQLAVRQGGLPFMRASARADLGIVEIFEHACREALKQRPVRQGYLLKQPGNWDPAKKVRRSRLARSARKSGRPPKPIQLKLNELASAAQNGSRASSVQPRAGITTPCG